MKHVDEYSPLCGPAAEEALKQYRSPYDERTFHFRQNLKLHKQVKRFEEHEEMLVMKRLMASHPDKNPEDLGIDMKTKNVGARMKIAFEILLPLKGTSSGNLFIINLHIY